MDTSSRVIAESGFADDLHGFLLCAPRHPYDARFDARRHSRTLRSAPQNKQSWAGARAKVRRIALVDPASFVVPFDYYLANAMADEGIAVDFYCSRTTANFELIERLRLAKRVAVFEYDVSSTVTGRLSGALNYLGMCLEVLRHAGRYDAVMLQYSIVPILELLLFLPVQRKLWLQIHDEAGLAERSRTPLLLRTLRRTCRRLLFASPAVMTDHLRSHPEAGQRVSLTRHGVLPVVPEDLRISVETHPHPEKALVFWGLVKSYKGVDLFGQLADSGMFKEFTLEIHGKWHPSTLQTKHALVQKGILVDDFFLAPADLRRLLLRPVVFVLPYRSASQSGVLYTLLNYGCVFISTDVGDNGQFLRERALGDLLFDRNDIRSAHRAVHFAYEHFTDLQEYLLKVRHEFDWADSAKAVAGCLEAQVDSKQS